MKRADTFLDGLALDIPPPFARGEPFSPQGEHLGLSDFGEHILSSVCTGGSRSIVSGQSMLSDEDVDLIRKAVVPQIKQSIQDRVKSEIEAQGRWSTSTVNTDSRSQTEGERPRKLGGQSVVVRTR